MTFAFRSFVMSLCGTETDRERGEYPCLWASLGGWSSHRRSQTASLLAVYLIALLMGGALMMCCRCAHAQDDPPTAVTLYPPMAGMLPHEVFLWSGVLLLCSQLACA